MGAIVKTKTISGTNLQPLLDYGSNAQKTDLLKNGLENLLSYAENHEKTTIQLPNDGETSLLITGVNCNPNIANEEFAVLRNMYREKHSEYTPGFDFLDKKTGEVKNVSKVPTTAIHIIQSFEETDIDPRVAHAIGVTLAERLGIQAVVDTHLDKDHIHNHIVANAYMPDGSTKFYMNKEKRVELRRLSDEIQKEFGVEISFEDPELQQKLSHSKSMNYREWDARKTGQSWKDDIRGHIINAKKMAEDKAEFIEIMQEYGYTIEKEKEDRIMWVAPKDSRGDGKKIWDRTLGEEYSVGSIFNPDKHEVTIETKSDIKKGTKFNKSLSVTRYDITNRRRSDIELLFRKAINIIIKVSNYFNKNKNKGKMYNANAKIQMMQEALKTLNEFGIEDLPDLNNKIDIAGKNLNLAKGAVGRLDSEITYYKYVDKIIHEYENAQTLYDSVYFWEKSHTLNINQYSNRDIAMAKASIAPLTVRQRSELYQLMEKHPDIRIQEAGKNYCNISALQFKEIRDYFKGKAPKPDCIISQTEQGANFAYEKIYESMSNNITAEPKQIQISEAMTFLERHGHIINNSQSLTMADIINIKNCYGDNPFSSELISEENIQRLSNALGDKHLNRPITSIMVSEFDNLMNYLEGRSKAIPTLLKEQMPPSDTDLEQIRQLSTLHHITSTVPLTDMTSKDVRDFKNFLVSIGKEPICVRNTSTTKHQSNQEAFHTDIECETDRKQEVLIGLRNSMNALSRLGICSSDIPRIKEQMQEVFEEKQSMDIIKEEFTDEYKQLLRLKQQTTYAQNKTFLFGSLFDEKEIKEIEKETEVKENEKDTEIEEQSKEKTQEKTDTTKDKAKQLIEKTLSKTVHRILDKDLDL